MEETPKKGQDRPKPSMEEPKRKIDSKNQPKTRECPQEIQTLNQEGGNPGQRQELGDPELIILDR